MNPSRHTADLVARLSAVDTSRLPGDGGPDFNRLIFEKSPYLLQHAANPVDWYPWGEEVFARARQEDKPVFLSIGYSTCHWCHVMAHESFENEEVAALLRRHYLAVKVDREERPDIDSTYMIACHMMTGSGGWPLTLVLTPERQPFFAATYLPTQSRQGAIGLIPLLQRIVRLWNEDRERLTAGGHQLTEALTSRGESGTRAGTLSPAPLREALGQSLDRFDRRYAGFGEAPKFPAPHNLALLLRLGRRFDDSGAGTMALKTLRAMRLGGVYDQVGFGLHRYAVDERWRIPHFEKMLYDQALLILAAVEAWQVGGDPFFAQIALETSSYLMRDLRDPQGAFYCGEDADSEGAEGTFYLWTPQQVEDALGRELATVYCRSFGITSEGNFEGRSIPHLEEDVATLAERAGVADTELAAALETARQRLFAVREKRSRPHRDDKILTAWNGLAIAALARAGAVLGDPELVTAAAAAAEFIADRLRTPEGRLLRRWRDGEAAILGFLEDYAFFSWGLLELHQARFRPEDLALAVELTRDMERLFGDGAGGLFDSGDDAEQVLGRSRSLQDGAIPSGTSVAIGNLLRLGRLCGDTGMEERGRQLLRLSLPEIERYPTAYAQALCGLDFALGPVLELALVPGRDGSPPTALLEAARDGFQPRLLLAATVGDVDSPHPLLPSLAERRPQDAPSAHLCRDRACLPPVTDPGELRQQLAGESVEL